MALKDKPAETAEKTNDEILSEFRALKTHAEKVKYFQANKDVLRLYVSEGCFHQ